MKRLTFITSMIIVTIVFACIATCCKSKPDPKEIQEKIAIDTIYTPSPEEATREILQFRDCMVYEHITDSTFRTMPREVLIRITMKHPDWSITQIVDEYILHKERYLEDKLDYEIIKDFEEKDSIYKSTANCF